MNIRPTKNKVVVQIDKPEAKVGTLFVTESKAPRTGVVMAVHKDVDTAIRVGARVQLYRIIGTQFKQDGRTFEVVHGPDILALL